MIVTVPHPHFPILPLSNTFEDNGYYGWGEQIRPAPKDKPCSIVLGVDLVNGLNRDGSSWIEPVLS